MRSTIPSDSSRGWCRGREERVGMIFRPSRDARAIHFTIALWVYPRCLATVRVLHPARTSRTASLLTRGSCGFIEYAMYIA